MGWNFLLIGLFFLLRMKFPAAVMARQQSPDRFSDYLAVFRSRDYVWLLVFVGLWGLPGKMAAQRDHRVASRRSATD